MGSSKKNFYALIDYCNNHIKNSNEYNILLTILKHIKDDVFPTLEKLSEEAFISQASVLRIIHKIGFDSYDELRVAIIKEPPEVLKRLQLRLLREGITSPEDIIEYEYELALRHLKTTKEMIDIDAVEKVIEFIENSNCVVLFGENYALSSSRSLQMDLLVNGITTIMLDKQSFDKDKLKVADENLVVMYNLFSKKYLDEETFETIKKFKNQKSKAVLFTMEREDEIQDFIELFDQVVVYGQLENLLLGHYSLFLLNRIIGDRLSIRRLEREIII